MNNPDFEAFANTSAGRCAASLLRTHNVKPKQIFDTVFAEVTKAWPHLVEGAKYKTEMLCDPEVWSALFMAEKRVAGMCLAYMVRKRLVALFQHKTRSGKGSNRYCKLTAAMIDRIVQEGKKA